MTRITAAKLMAVAKRRASASFTEAAKSSASATFDEAQASQISKNVWGNKPKSMSKKKKPQPRCLALCLMLALGLTGKAQATELLLLPITAATSAVSQSFQIRPGPGGQFLPTTMALQANFTWGSGGTTALAWAQTSFDFGVSWVDVCAFNFTTANAKFVVNVSSATPNAAVAITPTDGAYAGPNKCIDGIFGSMWRVKFQTAGTYVATTLRIDAISSGLTTLP